MREFEISQCKYWVIECGIGGTHSVTNLLKHSVQVSAITSIGLDHMEIIGNSKDKILWDKLGVWNWGHKIIIGPKVSKTDLELAIDDKSIYEDMIHLKDEEGKSFESDNLSITKEILKVLYINSNEKDLDVKPRFRLEKIKEIKN